MESLTEAKASKRVGVQLLYKRNKADEECADFSYGEEGFIKDVVSSKKTIVCSSTPQAFNRPIFWL